jgi:hypothetical protein
MSLFVIKRGYLLAQLAKDGGKHKSAFELIFGKYTEDKQQRVEGKHGSSPLESDIQLTTLRA